MPRSLLAASTGLSLLLSFHHTLSDETKPAKANAPAVEEVIIIGSEAIDKTKMDLETTRLLSVAGAANDPLKAIYALSSVTFSGGFGVSDPIIRGSAPNDNGYYIDGIPARYIFHVFGNSIFNKHLIHRFDFYPAAFSSQYSDAIGGVIDVSLREPENKPFTTTFNWSFLNTGILFESGIGSNMAFYGSYRKSLLREYDRLVDLKGKAEEDGFSVTALPADQDYQVKYLWDINSNHQLSLIAAGARDDLGAVFSEGNNLVERDPDFSGKAKITKGFDTQGLKWRWKNNTGTQSLSTHLSHTASKDSSVYGRGQFQEIRSNESIFRINGYTRLAQSHSLNWGINYDAIQYQFDLNAKIPTCNPNIEVECPTINAEFVRDSQDITINNPTVYIEDNFAVNQQHLVKLGLHITHDSYLSETRIEPRLRWDYLINTNWQIFASAGQYSQRPELLQILDLTGNPDLVSEKSNHYLAGIEHQFSPSLSLKTEFYYKTMDQLVISGITSDDNPTKFYSNDANGIAYGLEFLLNKTLTDFWYGWISLGLSETKRKNLLTDLETPFKYDKPIILNWVTNFNLSERWTLGLKWNYQSGGMYTPIIDVAPNAEFNDVLDPVYGELNSERLPDYHQLDIRVEYNSPKSWGYWKFYVDILDAYNRKNITGYRYAPNNKETIKPPKGFGKDVPVSASRSLGLIPSIGFEIQF